mgnify:CR=1 FL=1
MIDFSKTEEQELLIESIKELLEREMPAEKERECYRNGEFPWDAWKAMAEAGFTGLGLPEEVGGTDVDLMTVALANFTISRYGGPLAAFYSMGMPTMYDVCEFGTPEQIEKYVKPYIAGGAPLALGISEPSTGSDVPACRRPTRGTATPRSSTAASTTPPAAWKLRPSSSSQRIRRLTTSIAVRRCSWSIATPPA